jgi:hypothetical protein
LSPWRKFESANWFLVLAAVLVLVAYGFGLHGPFFFDDVPNLTANSHLFLEGSRFDEWRTASLSSKAGLFYRPISMFSFAANYFVAGGFSEFVFKLTNLFIHLAIAFCIYQLSLSVLRAPALAVIGVESRNHQIAALAAALIWALHPLHVSTVLYAVQRMAQLSTLFVLAGLVIFMQYRLKWVQLKASGGEIVALLLWLLLLTGLGMFSKENGVLLLWLIPVLEVTLFCGQWNAKSNRYLYALAWALFLLPIVIIVSALIIDPSTVLARFGSREFTLEERLLTQARILWFYLGWLTWPDIRAMGFHHDDIVNLIAWAALLIGAWILRRRKPLLLFAVFFFLVAHSMESSFIPLEMVYEHRNYLPSVGVIILIAYTITRFCEISRSIRLKFALAAVFSGLFILTATRSAIWSDALSLSRFNVVNHPDSPRANFFYGQVLYDELTSPGKEYVDKEQRKQLIITARSHFRRMHELSPRDFAGLVMLHQIDSIFFPGMPEGRQWLPVMLELAESRRLQASDRTALDALVEFSLIEPGLKDLSKVDQLFQVLLTRYPRDTRLVLARHRLLASVESVPDSARLAHLEAASRENPSNIDLHFAVAREQIPSNMGDVYIALGEGMKRDTLRRHLTALRQTFGQ